MRDERRLGDLEDALDATTGRDVALPADLARFYGALRLPVPADGPFLFANFVSTLDGVVSLGQPGTGGNEISGGSAEDHAVMGLLRAVADVVVVGAGTLRAFPNHVWTADAIYAPLRESYAALRASLGKTAAPLTVLVTGRGDVDPSWPVFSSGRAPCVVVTTDGGARELARRGGGALDVRVAGPGPALEAEPILRAIAPTAGSWMLLECGPHLMAPFLKARKLHELFLTLAPQIAGRASGTPREGFVAGATFLPDDPLWGDLIGLKRCGGVLFLRYRFPGHTK